MSAKFNDYVRCLLVDFSKAFGTVSHVLLIRKLQMLDIPPFFRNKLDNQIPYCENSGGYK